MNQSKQKKLLICILALLFLVASAILLTNNIMKAKADDNNLTSDFNFTQITNSAGEPAYKVALNSAAKVSAETIIVPNTYEGLPVTEIADNGFGASSKLTVVALPSSIEKIGNNAFANCKVLKHVSMPKVKTIGNNAFAMCPSLERMYFPQSITSVGTNILRNNSNEIYIQRSENEISNLWNSTWNQYFTGIETYDAEIGETLHYVPILDSENGDIIGYEIPEWQTLGDAGADMVIYTMVKSAAKPDEYLPLLNINTGAFMGTDVNSITIRDRHDDDPMFEPAQHKLNLRSAALSYTYAKEINIETSITLNHPDDLQNNNFENENGKSTYVFAGSLDLEAITLPEDIDEITSYMFSDCNFLKQIKIGKNTEANNLMGITKIGQHAFEGCFAIDSITLPSTVVEVGKAAFDKWGYFETQEINVSFFEDDLPAGWDINWLGNIEKDNVDVTFLKTIPVTIYLHDKNDTTIEIKVKPNEYLPYIEKPTWIGHEFKGIFTEPDGNGEQFYNSEMESVHKWVQDEPTSLHVYWELINYSITYKNIENAAHSNPEEYNYDMLPIRLEPAHRSGYDFIGWFDNEDLSGDSISDIQEETAGDLVFYAKWKAQTFDIEYVFNVDNVYNPNDNHFTADIEYTFQEARRDGYRFVGWYTDETYQHEIKNIPICTYKAQIIYGYFTPYEYEIRYYNLNGAYNPNDDKFTADIKFTLNDPVREGYKFGGWYYKDDFSGGRVYEIPENTYHDVTIYAKWIISCNFYDEYGSYYTTIDVALDINGNGQLTLPAITGGYNWNGSYEAYQTITVSASTDFRMTEKSLVQLYDSYNKSYEIWTYNQLNQVRDYVATGVTFNLMADIVTYDWNPIENFTGTFNGNDHIITIYKHSIPAAANYGFVIYNNGTIISTTFKAYFTNEEYAPTGGNFERVGVIAAYNNKKITYCTVESYVGINNDFYEGKQVYADIVFADAHTFIGGIAGENQGTISYCDNYASIGGVAAYVGGITARNFGSIYNCKNYGDLYYIMDSIVAPIYAGIAAMTFANSSFSYCSNYANIVFAYFDKQYITSDNYATMGQVIGVINYPCQYNGLYALGRVVADVLKGQDAYYGRYVVDEVIGHDTSKSYSINDENTVPDTLTILDEYIQESVDKSKDYE